MTDYRSVAIVVAIVGALNIWYQVHVYREQQTNKSLLHHWLKENDLEEFVANLEKSGIKTPEQFSKLDINRWLAKHYAWLKLSQFSYLHKKLEGGVTKMQDQLQLYSWLEQNNLEKYYPQLMSQGFRSIQSVIENMNEEKLEKLTEWDQTLSDFSRLQKAVETVKTSKKSTGKKSNVYSGFLFLFGFVFSWIWWISKLIAKSILYIIISVFLWFAGRASVRHVNRVRQQHKVSIFSYVLGSYLQPRNTTVTWGWNDLQEVGNTMTFFLKFYRQNRTAHPISERSSINIEILHNGNLIANTVEFGSNKRREQNMMKVTFTVRQAGEYTIAVMAAGEHIGGSPFKKTFLSGPVDPSKCLIVERSSILVVQKGIYSPLMVEARDKYGNVCHITRPEDILKYHVDIKEVGSQASVDPELFVDLSESLANNVLHIKLEQEGCYMGVVSYDGNSLDNGELTIISLNDKEIFSLEKNLDKHCYNVWYEATLLPVPLQDTRCTVPSQGERTTTDSPPPVPTVNVDGKKNRKVYCYISPRHVSVKEFYMKIFPHKLHAFRVSPRTKFILHSPDPNYEYPTFTLSDGAQTPVSIMCRDRNILVATFSRLVLFNIGGSESFKKKQQFFYQQLLSHQGTKYGERRLKIDRFNILESSYSACKNLSNGDWFKRFSIKFEGEEGLDWGGLTREWFELLCAALFGHENKLFTRFNEDDPQALVHPNSKRPTTLKLKYYEFAGRIVGKCLFESAAGLTRRQNVKAKFTRSFLAQILGLKITYKYFESDDKDLYRSKIQYIEETNPEDLELMFSEEEYNSSGQVLKVVDLKPGGSQISVTQENKLEYLKLLAQYRLVTSTQQETDSFIKGLNEIVPDSLLSIFDEYELELLMCGTGHISVADMKQHHTITSGGGQRCHKVLNWFWTIVASLTQEELARLVQFITGSSQLPPGGFSELSPQLQISFVPMYEALPTAHTCFNQLCLPDYSSFEEMQRKLLIAITDGSEGFGMI